MTNTLSSASLAALGLALIAGSSPAGAQTVVTRAISDPAGAAVIAPAPVRTVETVETVRTVRPARRTTARRVVTTRRTIVSESVVPAAPVVAAQTYPRPLYDVVTAPAPTVDETVINAAVPVAPALPTYRYVYEPDRILVVDPVTNIAIQSIPR